MTRGDLTQNVDLFLNSFGAPNAQSNLSLFGVDSIISDNVIQNELTQCASSLWVLIKWWYKYTQNTVINMNLHRSS